MPQVTSKDGTVIGFDRMGAGPPVVIVNGSLGYRDYFGDRELAGLLAAKFTVVIYDRRGRGESTDTPPYAIEREIEDIEALIDAVGGRACLYGVSSGAALALKATARLGAKVTKLAMYEPPYGTDANDREEHERATQQLNECLTAGDRGGAVALFMGNFMAADEIEAFRRSSPEEWATLEAVAPTLAYDYAIMAEQVPPADAASVSAPALILTGSEGLPYLDEAIEIVVAALPAVRRETLAGESHSPSAEALAPRLIEFFS